MLASLKHATAANSSLSILQEYKATEVEQRSGKKILFQTILSHLSNVSPFEFDTLVN